jgi:hypothetical protein
VRAIESTFAAKLAFFKAKSALFFAFSAPCAPVFVKKHLLFFALTFGIVAPSATQIAPLEENGGAYARSVHERGSLNIKNSSSKHGYSSIGQIVIV